MKSVARYGLIMAGRDWRAAVPRCRCAPVLQNRFTAPTERMPSSIVFAYVGHRYKARHQNAARRERLDRARRSPGPTDHVYRRNTISWGLRPSLWTYIVCRMRIRLHDPHF
jgi:hypothetical protein